MFQRLSKRADARRAAVADAAPRGFRGDLTSRGHCGHGPLGVPGALRIAQQVRGLRVARIGAGEFRRYLPRRRRIGISRRRLSPACMQFRPGQQDMGALRPLPDVGRSGNGREPLDALERQFERRRGLVAALQRQQRGAPAPATQTPQSAQLSRRLRRLGNQVQSVDPSRAGEEAVGPTGVRRRKPLAHRRGSDQTNPRFVARLRLPRPRRGCCRA